jgi:hypothetical protein
MVVDACKQIALWRKKKLCQPAVLVLPVYVMKTNFDLLTARLACPEANTHAKAGPRSTLQHSSAQGHFGFPACRQALRSLTQMFKLLAAFGDKHDRFAICILLKK